MNIQASYEWYSTMNFYASFLQRFYNSKAKTWYLLEFFPYGLILLWYLTWRAFISCMLVGGSGKTNLIFLMGIQTLIDMYSWGNNMLQQPVLFEANFKRYLHFTTIKCFLVIIAPLLQYYILRRCHTLHDTIIHGILFAFSTLVIGSPNSGHVFWNAVCRI